jgi:hypothetical protein
MGGALRGATPDRSRAGCRPPRFGGRSDGQLAPRRSADPQPASWADQLVGPRSGPTSWSLVTQELARRGHPAIVASLVAIATAPEPQWRYALSAVRAMTVGISSPIVLVGHAAAGSLLPGIADVVAPKVAGLIFVDCEVPPTDGSASLAAAQLREQVRALADDSLLPRSSWFRQQVAEGLIPPLSPAATLVQEIPALPLSCLTDRVPMPTGWGERSCGYVLLTPAAHTESAIRAHARGWPVTALPGAHQLPIITNPLTITDTLLDLTRTLHPHTDQRAA